MPTISVPKIHKILVEVHSGGLDIIFIKIRSYKGIKAAKSPINWPNERAHYYWR